MRIPIPFHQSTSPESSALRSVHDARGVLISGVEEKCGVGVAYTERVPHDLDETRGTVVVAPGLYGLKWTYGDFRDELADELHARVRTYRHDRRGVSARVGAQSVAHMIDSAIGANPAAPVVVVGHSKGGPDAVDGVLDRISAVSDVVLIGSGGLEEGQSVFRLAGRFPGVVAREIVPGAVDLAARQADHGKIIGEAIMHGLSNPWLLFGEMMNVANRRLMDRELRQLRDASILVHAIQFDQDGFFPLEQATARTPGLVDTFTVMKHADHLAPQLQAGAVATHVAQVIGLSQIQLASAA